MKLRLSAFGFADINMFAGHQFYVIAKTCSQANSDASRCSVEIYGSRNAVANLLLSAFDNHRKLALGVRRNFNFQVIRTRNSPDILPRMPGNKLKQLAQQIFQGFLFNCSWSSPRIAPLFLMLIAVSDQRLVSKAARFHPGL